MQKSESISTFISRVISVTRPYAIQFALGFVFLLAGSAVNLALPQLIRFLLDSQYSDSALQNPLLTVGLLFVIFAGQNLFFYLRSSLFSSVGIKVGADLRSKLFAGLIKEPLEFHDTNNWADIRSRLVSDIQLVQDAISLRLSVFLRYGIQILIATICLFFISIRLASITLAVVPVIAIVGALMGRKLKKLSALSQQKLAQTNADAQEGLGQIRLVKLLSAESDFIKRFKLNNNSSAASFSDRAKFAASFSSSMNFLLTFAVAVVVLYGTSLVKNLSLSAGDFAAFSLYAVILAVSFGFAVSAYSELLQAMAAAERVFPLISNEDSTHNFLVENSLEQSIQLETLPSEALTVQFQDVTFAYPSRPDQLIFQKFNLALAANSCTAIVGPSGSGKSSIINLLLGLYKPLAGEVLINAKPIDQKTLQSLMAVVPQDGFLVSGSLRDNLSLGSSDYTDLQMTEAIKKTGLGSLLDTLSLDADLGERGSQLSGGQKQRLAIARALLKNPALLVLDEASSALDSESERILLELITQLKQHCTVVLVTHRITSLSVADRVLVLHKGRIVQDGTYREVLDGPGMFKSMLETDLVEKNCE